ncbi:C40 family peptidase [Roseivivax sp. THAF30]|uniref:C40 family peptidase n=1 Tax=Roseivivax sp. THAF30 TaxID=2587852 RepID=UPI0012A8C093|nr:C40 family peptidase [Roseivivax sp. THAF30]QFT64782.1 Dipeptidyl-peptidase 6 [Roseivivax sp. THAF30]
MSRDRRLTPANGRVALSSLAGQVEAERFVEGVTRRISVPVADLCAAPDGPRDRQLLLGAEALILEERGGWTFLQSRADGYTGYVRSDALSDGAEPTHRVSARATHVYPRPDMKSPERLALSMGAMLCAAGTSGNFTETSIGFVPSQHLAPLADRAPDPVAVAEALVGTPYLWGGNSSFGIDCSGLVQIALRACGADCPGDSDLQEAVFASLAAPDGRRRGDLLFWKGHVGWIAGPDLLLHANAYHMAVAYEDLDTAIRRITAQGDGPVTSHVRPNTPEAP